MQTLAIISPEIAALGSDKVDLIVRTLMSFDDYYKTEEPMVTDIESEWPSEYGWIHFVISKTDKLSRTLRINFSTHRTKNDAVTQFQFPAPTNTRGQS